MELSIASVRLKIYNEKKMRVETLEKCWIYIYSRLDESIEINLIHEHGPQNKNDLCKEADCDLNKDIFISMLSIPSRLFWNLDKNDQVLVF